VHFFIFFGLLILVHCTLYLDSSSVIENNNCLEHYTIMPFRFPLIAVSHGAPNLILQTKDGAFQFMTELGKSILKQGTPKAVLMISAHWEAPEFTVQTSPEPEMIYDFGGFEEELYTIQYPAKSLIELSNYVCKLLKANNLSCSTNNKRGYDHGCWVPLKIMFPEAKIPVVQLSLKRNLNPTEHITLGKILKPLREEGYLIIGSGSATHNLGAIGYHETNHENNPFTKFDSILCNILTESEGNKREESLIELLKNPTCSIAHPRTEHLIPYYVIAGMAEGKGKQIYKSMEFGSLSMASYQFDN